MFSLKTESPGHLAFLGVVATAVGLAAIVWPGVTIGVAVALFAIYCFINAIGQLFAMVAVEKSVGRDILRLVLALIDVAAGIVAVAYPGITAAVLVFVVGFWAIFGGSIELAGAWTGRNGWLAFTGLLNGRGRNRADGLAGHWSGLTGADLRHLPTRRRDHVAGLGRAGEGAPEPRSEVARKLGSRLICGQLSTIAGAARGSRP